MLDQSGIVNKIPCNHCTAIYIGQTKRYLRTRVNAHKKCCNQQSYYPGYYTVLNLKILPT